MKRLIALVLVTFLLASLFASCGKKAEQSGSDAAGAAVSDTVKADDAGESGGNDGGNAANAAAGNKGGIYKEAGSELTDYSTAFTDAQKPFGDALESGLTDPDMDILSAQMTVAMPELSLALLGMYDLLSIEDLPKEEGTLMLSGGHGIREKKGSEIKFTGNLEYTEDKGMNKKGDKVLDQGTLNTSTNTLVYEYKLENAGKTISRSVMECVILKDGTYLLQYLSMNGGSGGSDKPTGMAAFKRFNGKEYTALAATFEGGTDFKYDSIVGKGDIQPDAMASKYTVKGRFTVKDGKVEAAKK